MVRPARRATIAGAGALLATSQRLLAAPAPPTLSPAAMRGDLALLRRGYATLHPALLRYSTMAEVDARFGRLAADKARPMPLPAFYLALWRLPATIRCGHSYADFYNQAKPVQAALFDAPGQPPLQFAWPGEAMVVSADPFGTGIAPGSRVLAVSGVPAARVLGRLMTVARRRPQRRQAPPTDIGAGRGRV